MSGGFDVGGGQFGDGFGVGFKVVVGQVIDADEVQVAEQFGVGIETQGEAACDVGFCLSHFFFGRTFGDELPDDFL